MEGHLWLARKNVMGFALVHLGIDCEVQHEQRSDLQHVELPASQRKAQMSGHHALLWYRLP